MIFLFAVYFTLIVQSAAHADWPEAPWLNEPPRPSAILSAVAFVSPADAQFLRMAAFWKKFDKRYSSLNVEFLIVAMKEPGLPFNESLVSETLKALNYNLPVYLDGTANYSKLWRAYVSPTVNLVSKNGKVTSFDPGNFDPVSFEKMLQKLLKENGVTGVPAREFKEDSEVRNCGHEKTFSLGEKYQKSWSPTTLNIEGALSLKPLWADAQEKPWSIELGLNRATADLLAESPQAGAARITVTLDGQRIPQEIRGRDIQEDKTTSTTFVTVHGPRIYQLISHAQKLKETPAKLALSGDGKPLRVYNLQTLPYCLEP